MKLAGKENHSRRFNQKWNITHTRLFQVLERLNGRKQQSTFLSIVQQSKELLCACNCSCYIKDVTQVSVWAFKAVRIFSFIINVNILLNTSCFPPNAYSIYVLWKSRKERKGKLLGQMKMTELWGWYVYCVI